MSRDTLLYSNAVLPHTARLLEMRILVEGEYLEFLEYCLKSNDGQSVILMESFSSTLKNTVDFIKELGKTIGFRVKELIELFKNKEVFSLFRVFGFDMSIIIEAVKTGYDIYKKIVNFIPDLMTKLVVNSKLHKWTSDQVAIIDDWLQKNKWVYRITGIALAGLFIVIWLNMSFVGDLEGDMDISFIFDAVAGRFSIREFFLSESGVKTLVLLGTGVLGLSFTWWKTPVNIMVAIVSTLAKRYRISMRKE